MSTFRKELSLLDAEIERLARGTGKTITINGKTKTPAMIGRKVVLIDVNPQASMVELMERRKWLEAKIQAELRRR